MISRETVIELFKKMENPIFSLIRLDDDIFREEEIPKISCQTLKDKLHYAFIMYPEVYGVRQILSELTLKQLKELEIIVAFYVSKMLEEKNLFNENDFIESYTNISNLKEAIDKYEKQITTEINFLGIKKHEQEVLYLILFWYYIEKIYLKDEISKYEANLLELLIDFRNALECYRLFITVKGDLLTIKLSNMTFQETIPQLQNETIKLCIKSYIDGEEEHKAFIKKTNSDTTKKNREKEYGSTKKFVLDNYNGRNYTSMRQATLRIEEKYIEWVKTNKGKFRPLTETNRFNTIYKWIREANTAKD